MLFCATMRVVAIGQVKYIRKTGIEIMLILWCSLAGLMLYLELVYHFSGFGWSGFWPVYLIMLITAWAGVETIIIGVLRKWLKKFAWYLALWLPVVWTGAQLVYLRIFRQPLLWEAMFRGGGDALTNYWREALDGILRALPFLILLILPAVALPLVLKRVRVRAGSWNRRKVKWDLPTLSLTQVMQAAAITAVGIAGSVVVMQVGKYLDADYYEVYDEFYDPLTVAEYMGVLPALQRDTSTSLQRLVSGMMAGGRKDPAQVMAAGGESSGSPDTEANLPETGAPDPGQDGNSSDTLQQADPGQTGSEQEKQEGEVPEEPKLPFPHQFDLDYETLHALADNKEQIWLADYIQGLEPTLSNEYTGIFEGYNLIYLTAEGFSTYAIREDLTPTLYRLTHSGFVFDNYYVPLWQTSTIDGEYINCTALIPDGQFSLRKSSENQLPYTLPRFFEKEGVKSFAYHDNTLSYYDRNVTHPHLGYDFKASKLGELSEEEWGDKIFPMENPNAWPASDLEMMQGTMSEYLAEERFHVYYMTVSGHLKYSFTGNAMSSKNREAVADLDMSEGARAYIACHIELDKALEYMLKQLEEAGVLDKTVICLSADHYPYDMPLEEYEELAGRSLSEGMDLYRNSLILWNSAMEEEPVHVSKACGSMDIVPTLLNLFGFDYDSRMYAGRDIFSDEEGMVIFNDRSFVTDSVINPKKLDPIWLKDAEGNDIIPEDQREEYFAGKKQEVKDRYQFSAYILRENYYADVEQAKLPSDGK